MAVPITKLVVCVSGGCYPIVATGDPGIEPPLHRLLVALDRSVSAASEGKIHLGLLPADDPRMRDPRVFPVATLEPRHGTALGRVRTHADEVAVLLVVEDPE